MKTCPSCYNKRYFSYLCAYNQAADFYGDKAYRTPFKIEYRRCTRCRSKKIIPKDTTI